MKFLNIVKMAFAFAVMLLTTSAFAQSENNKNVPVTVVSALKQKYPDAEIISWKNNNNLFTARIKVSGKKYSATFNNNGTWVNTESTISWPWSLPTNIRTAYKKSGYNGWNIYVSKKVENPKGEFYELLVDNSELIRLKDGVIPTGKVLMFNANGTLADVTTTGSIAD